MFGFRKIPDASGFTLLEVMASLAILGIGVVLIIQLFSGGLGLARASQEHTDIVLLANEKMGEMMESKDIEEGTANGEEDGVRWTIDVSRYEIRTSEDNPKPRIYKIVVSVNAPGMRGSSFTLTSLKAVMENKL